MADPGSTWSGAEVQIAVTSYFRMLKKELLGEPFVKAEENRLVSGAIGRSKASVEFKFSNISAVLRDLRLLYIRGYKPLSNYQGALHTEVVSAIERDDSLSDLMAQQVLEPEPVTPVDLAWSLEEGGVPAIEIDENVWTQPRSARQLDFVQLEAANRELGLAGEMAVVGWEKSRLEQEGRPDLSAAVEHVAVTRGDGLGFDVLSFDHEGNERLIEVKTTRRDIQWPFYVSRNEVEVSKAESERFRLYRLHDFERERSRFYVLPGALDMSCSLDANSVLGDAQESGFTGRWLIRLTAQPHCSGDLLGSPYRIVVLPYTDD